MEIPYVYIISTDFIGNAIGCIIKCSSVLEENYSSLWEQIEEDICLVFDPECAKVNCYKKRDILTYRKDNASIFIYKEQDNNGIDGDNN